MKLNLFDYIKWSGDIGTLAYRHPQNNIGKYTKLQVSEAQEAVIIVNGERSQKFGCGTHTLDSPNMPILREFYGVPYGGENPWVVQVWFVNKLTPMNINWDVDSFSIFDESFGAAIPISARGSYGVTVVDPERFIFKLALGFPSVEGRGVSVTANDFTEQVQGELMVNIKSLITRVMASNKISITAVSAHLNDLSKSVEAQVNSFFEEFGCRLLKFYITSIGVDESTEGGRLISESISKQTAQRISGYTWQQGRAFETVDNALSGVLGGGGGGVLGAVMAVNMIGGMGNGGGLMTPPTGAQPSCAPVNPNSTDDGAVPPPIRRVYCSNCSKQYTSDNQFCPYCGDKYNPCPKCGSDNDTNATRCVNCGVTLGGGAVEVCGGCGRVKDSNWVFCPSCGRPSSAANLCPRCKSELKSSAPFCPRCGYKVR